jgi:hypothetical protein
VRLDHLLSKEHLQQGESLDCQSHFADTCSAVVSSWVEHRRLAGRKRRHQPVRLFGGWIAGVGGVRVACTLLGPEGSDTGTEGDLGAGTMPRTLAGSLGLVPVVRGSTDRMLRTTQWTRASFSSRTTRESSRKWRVDEEITMFVTASWTCRLRVSCGWCV